jgi:hypothetical protein
MSRRTACGPILARKRNVYADTYAGRTLWTQHMAESDLKVTDSRAFTVLPCPVAK